ncbi:MAG: acyltransferase [Terracidiphilus sp.]
MRAKGTEKFLSIQALRIVAATLVLITHSTFYVSERLDHGFPVWERGTRGVDIFFIISGFVMIFSSQKLVEVANGWKIFAERRLLRIVPLYWIVTTLKAAIVLSTVGFALHTKVNFTTAACSYLFLPARDLDGKIEPLVGVGWTLNFEMLFYLLFCLALFFRINVFKFVGTALAILSIGAFFRGASWPPIAFYLNSIVLEFFLGMLVARACINGIRIPRKLAVPLLALGLGCLLLPSSDFGLPTVIVRGLPAALIIWSAASLGSLQNLIPGFILYLGDASYAIYLIHPFVAPLPPTLLHRLHSDSPLLSVALSVALGLGIGCLLYQFIERPVTSLLNDRRKLHGRLPQIATCAPDLSAVE